MPTAEMAHFRVLTINIARVGGKNIESNSSQLLAIAVLISEEEPDIVLLQNVNKRRDVEFIDYYLSKLWKHYNYYLKYAHTSVAVMGRSDVFKMSKVSFSNNFIIGTMEEKEIIQRNLALVRLTHKETKNFLFVGSWFIPENLTVTDMQKKRLSSLLLSLMRKETVGSFWLIGGDFGITYDENPIHPAQEHNGEFFNLVEDSGRSAHTKEEKNNYFVFSGKSGHRRMTFSNLQMPKCKVEKTKNSLSCSPVLGTASITWAASSPPHIDLHVT